MTAESRSVVVRLSAETAAYIREMQAAGRLGTDAMQQVERATLRADSAVSKTAQTTKRAGLVIAAGLGLAVKAAIDWESQWTGVLKTVDGTTAQLNDLEGGLRDMAKTLPESHQEIAAVAEAAGQLGVQTPNVEAFTKTMVQLGETTNLTSEQAATDIAQIENVMRTASDETDNLGASLVALGNNGASTEAQILAMANRIAATGAQVGLTEADILGLANAAASMGIEVEAGGSAVSRVFQTMAKDVAAGGDKLELFAQVSGMTAQQFAKEFGDDPARAFAAFTQGLDRINKSGGDVFGVLDKLSLSDIRVSQALLSMASSGDYLTKSLDLSAQAWDQNTALQDEFAKRAGTTASQVQVSINNIRDAAIDLGTTLLPIVSDIASGVSTVSNAFGSLPDPLQSVIGKATALALVVGGAGWFGAKAVLAVKTMRLALVELGITADVTKAKLATVGTGVTAAAIGISSLMNTLDLMDSYQRSQAARSSQGGGLADFADELAYSNLGKNAESLHINLQRLTEDLQQNGTDGEYAAKVMAELQDKSHGLDAAVKALYGHTIGVLPIVPDGDSSIKAADAYSDLLDITKAYDDVLGTAATTTDTATVAIQGNTEAVQLNYAAIQEQRDAARQTAQSFVGLGDSLSDSKVTLDEWIRDLEKQAAALRNFRINAQTAAKKGLDEGLIASLQEAGPAGALRLKQLADASEKEIRRANAAWRGGQREVDAYTNAIGGVGNAVENLPSQAKIRIIAESDPARAEVLSFKSWLASQNLTKTVRLVTTGGLGPRDSGFAEGGFTGRGSKWEPAGIVHRGEVVIPQDLARRDWTMLSARYGHLPGFADGGVVGTPVAQAMTTSSVDRFNNSIERSRAAVEKETSAREKLISLRGEFASAVTGGFRSDIFGGGAWGAGSPLEVLQSDIANAAAYRRTIRDLRARGLNGAALAEATTLQQAQLLSGMSNSELRRYERLYGQRQRLSSRVGQEAGVAAYGAQIREQTSELKALRAAVDRLDKTAAHAAKDMGDAVGDKLNGNARRGAHDRSHPRVG